MLLHTWQMGRGKVLLACTSPCPCFSAQLPLGPAASCTWRPSCSASQGKPDTIGAPVGLSHSLLCDHVPSALLFMQGKEDAQKAGVVLEPRKEPTTFLHG